MRFYDFKGAPSPTKVRIVIAEKGIEIPTESVNLRTLEQQGEAYRRVHPGATVPTLLLDDGTRLTESHAIAHYLEQLYPEPALMGKSPRDRALIVMWHDITALEGYVGAQEMLRNGSEAFKGRAVPGIEPFEQIPALVDRGRRRIDLYMDKLNRRLEESEYLAGDGYSYADISAFVTVGFIQRVLGDDPAAGHTAVARWAAAVAARPAVVAATQ